MDMIKLTTISVISFSLILTGCFESSSETRPPPAIAPSPVGVAANGHTYYQNRCGICHSAGQDDPSSAFGAVDLAQKQDMMTGDISSFDKTSGYNLMGAFDNIPVQRVADLKAYLKSVPVL